MLTALTLGNFDGIHLGHQKLITSLKQWKASQKVPINCAVMTFEPHPREVLGGQIIPRLSSPESKKALLKDLGVDEVQTIKFDLEFSQKNATEFLDFLLHQQQYPLSFLSVGKDFQFGHNREGNTNLLSAWCKKQSLILNLVDPVLHAGSVVSSSRIREVLAQGHVKNAAELLGRNFSFQGQVIRGHQQGKILGFPTANLIPPGLQSPYQLCLPQKGVYLTKTHVHEEKATYPSVTNIGVKPTLGDGFPLCIETHLLNYSGTLYEKEIAVEFIDRIRDEMRFASLNDLREQIQRDIAQATKLHSRP